MIFHNCIYYGKDIITSNEYEIDNPGFNLYVFDIRQHQDFSSAWTKKLMFDLRPAILGRFLMISIKTSAKTAPSDVFLEKCLILFYLRILEKICYNISLPLSVSIKSGCLFDFIGIPSKESFSVWAFFFWEELSNQFY